jgi:Phytanoyl-CoA dioxygenase (PhyH)
MFMNLNDSLQAVLYKGYHFFAKNPWEQKIEMEIDQIHDLVQGESGIATVHDTMPETAQSIADIVSTKGYMLFPKILSKDVLDKLRSEYQAILTTDVNTFQTVDRSDDGAVCVRMTPFFNLNNLKRYPVTSAFFNARLFHEITKRFYTDSKNGVDYISEIFVHETPETKDPMSGKLHWDRAQTLKFWVYLDDVPLEAGPMRVEPDSVQRNKKIRIQSHNEKGTLIGGVENVVESPVLVPIALTAPAGSILIHNTDASHGATEVMAGHVRKILRGHCRARS